MLYLVDGYNVTRADPSTRDLSLEQQREALVSRLRVRGRELLGAGRIVVVFDGRQGEGLAAGSGQGVEVRFSRDENADDVIVRLAARASGSVCVVTSDRELEERVRTHASGPGGVESRARECLFDSARPPARKRGRGRQAAASVGIPAGGNSITAELKALWLTEEACDGCEDEE